MKKDLDRVDAKEAVFAENVKAKFSFQKLMYLSVTVNEIRYYTYGILVTCMILISSIVRNL